MSRIYKTLGTVAMTPKGEYDSSAYYEYLNIVDYEGSSYVAKQASHGILPTNENYWLYLGGGVKKENTIIVYDNVANMKADTKLKAGMTVKTKGYRSIDDGGSGEYVIVDDETLVDDGGLIHALNNGLRAKLIIEEPINIKQFGAYGDGEHDDSNIIQNAINILRNSINNELSFSTKLNELNFNGGKYKILNTIILSPLIHLRFNSTTTFLNYNDNCCIKIKPLNDDFYYSSDYSIRDRNVGKILSGNGGLILINKADDNAIGIEMGMTSNEYNSLSAEAKILNTLADGYYENVLITRFKYGLKINSVSFYINTFDNFKISRNDTAIYITSDSINAGEKIVFNNGEFGSNKIVVQNNANHFNTIWNYCSFDYNTKYVMEFTKPSITYLNDCHIEHNLNTDISENEKIGQFISNNTSGTNKIYFNNIYLYTGNTDLVPLTNGDKALIYLNNIEDSIGTINNPNDHNNLFMNLSPVFSLKGFYSNKRMSDIVNNKIIDYMLLDESVGDITTFKNFDISSVTNVTNKSIISENDENVILISGNDNLENTNFSITLTSNYKIPINNHNNKMVANLKYKIDSGSVQSRIISKYYDSSNNQIGSTDTQYGTSLTTTNQYIKNEFPLGKATIPKNAVSMSIGFSFTVTNGTELYIKNMCLNEI